jgi:hypothetical protein
MKAKNDFILFCTPLEFLKDRCCFRLWERKSKSKFQQEMKQQNLSQPGQSIQWPSFSLSQEKSTLDELGPHVVLKSYIRHLAVLSIAKTTMLFLQ